MSKLDFFATEPHYIDHMLPVWRELPDNVRGDFYVHEKRMSYCIELGLDCIGIPEYHGEHMLRRPIVPPGDGPVLVSAYGDLKLALLRSPNRPVAFIEHGAGFTMANHPAYPGGGELRKKVDLFLSPNIFALNAQKKAIPGAKQVLIGCPKLDKYKGQYDEPHLMPDHPRVAISFHWPGLGVCPEAGNALPHFRRAIGQLSRQPDFQLVGHGHPKYYSNLKANLYDSLKMESVRSFEAIMETTDVYIVDTSSTIYEYLVTGKPVILMNSPSYRRNVHHGLRFWLHSEVGLNVNNPEELLPAIRKTIQNPGIRWEERQDAIREVYPYLGESSNRAAIALSEWVTTGKTSLLYKSE